ncbi:PolC-type DNA polymerase III [Kitasatospora sp. NPDC059327]|uniref:3'-5' exonuclease n=1 Tax=Kitasatospora sp. NPDC059327 TaxID=3346803 RepID=UPI00368E3AB5
MAQHLTFTDPKALATSFATVDFETLTPAGRRPEPTEVAVQVRRLNADGTWEETARFEALIRPPADVPVTDFDTRQTGITAAMLTGARTADYVLADLEQGLLGHVPYILVAHNAPYEAGLIHDRAAVCPTLARTTLLDTVRLARTAYPELAHHRLDDLLRHHRLPSPAGRHRAMPDVEATSEIFARLLADGARDGHWSTLADMRRLAGVTPKAVLDDEEAARPQQDSLF